MRWFRILWSMRVTMGNAKILSPAQIWGFLEASDGIDFSGTDRAGVYQWIEETLRYRYSQQLKEVRGVLREFLVKVKMTGLSVPQVTRLIGRYLHTGQVREQEYQRHRFASHYRKDDIVFVLHRQSGLAEASRGRFAASMGNCRDGWRCSVN